MCVKESVMLMDAHTLQETVQMYASIGPNFGESIVTWHVLLTVIRKVATKLLEIALINAMILLNIGELNAIRLALVTVINMVAAKLLVNVLMSARTKHYGGE